LATERDGYRRAGGLRPGRAAGAGERLQYKHQRRAERQHDEYQRQHAAAFLRFR
jgi:hypothetical protein